MVTGDHPHTAKEIGRQLALLDSKNEPAIVGADMKPFENLTPEDKQRWLASNIFARVTPAQKLDLIKVYQENGAVVGMTGDGVNDAPALKKADIGIAMGLRGTQVAQDVADMVLKDDSFSSIVTAIRQGRIIFDNIRKFVIFLLSCNLSELFTIAITAVFNLHFQLFPLQILFINLITDVLPALALGMTSGNANIMKQKPRNADQPIIEQTHWKAVIVYSIIISASSLGAVFYSHYALHTTEEWNPKLCNNILFFTLIISQLLHVLNMNSSGTNFFKSEVMRNKYVWYAFAINLTILVLLYEINPVREVLSIYSLSFSDWMVITSFSVLGMIANQMVKVLSIIKQ
jgi:Ca2+-transporting ATPase